MSGGAKTLAGLFGMTEFMIPVVLDDLSEAQGRERPRGEGGPSIAWTIGHLMHSRIWVLQALGVERDNPWEEKFGNVAASDGSDYPALAEMLEAWNGLSDDLMDALAALTEDRLDTPVESWMGENRTLRDQIVFFAWHEGYHMGAIGQIRKSLGLPGPAERIMAARAAEEGA